MERKPTTPGEARQFFIDKIANEALRQGMPLTEVQRYMLSWSESDPDFVNIPDMNAAFDRENSDHEFEKMVVQLIKRTFKGDIQTNPALRDNWRAAYNILKKGDHYILVMLDESRILIPWWKLTF